MPIYKLFSIFMRQIVLMGLFCYSVNSSEAGAPSQGFFRITGQTNSAITGYTSQGLLTWTNAAVGDSCDVEWLGSLGVSNSWETFVHYSVTSSVSQVQVFVPTWPAPTGMSFIATSRFQMGNCMDANEGWSDELPVHEVYVTPFFVDQVEVTKALWDEVYGWATNHGYGFDNIGFGKGTNYPVEVVNWYDVVKWCNARSERESLVPVYYMYEFVLDQFGDIIGTNIVVYRTGLWNIRPELAYWTATGYRLPTEAEWELAARGGALGHRFPWAETDTITQTNANYNSFWEEGVPYYPYDENPTDGFAALFNTGEGTEPFTSPVASFVPNAYGLYDMAGNVSEWCWDWYDEVFYTNVYATIADSRGPVGPGSSSARVLRGGNWFDVAYQTRCSYRESKDPGASTHQLGFRCVRSR
ncbi:MAG: SUMF1/EgtB/PvdO family nonheme iron enzyme [bacterium]